MEQKPDGGPAVSKRLVVYCEGQTEELFVNRLLRPHLGLHGIKVERPILAATSHDPRGQRGGFVNWEAIAFDLRTEFAQDADPELRFTTLLDTYAMPKVVLTLAGLNAPAGTQTEVEAVEQAIAGHFNEPRFKAYLQRHELEALLLADIAALGRVFHRHTTGIAALGATISGFSNPEDINHGSSTHPAARLETAIPGYGVLKDSNAYWVLAEAGLDGVRSRCPRFDAWLSHWENWASV
jgi:hypothetical protein